MTAYRQTAIWFGSCDMVTVKNISIQNGNCSAKAQRRGEATRFARGVGAALHSGTVVGGGDGVARHGGIFRAYQNNRQHIALRKTSAAISRASRVARGISPQ